MCPDVEDAATKFEGLRQVLNAECVALNVHSLSSFVDVFGHGLDGVRLGGGTLSRRRNMGFGPMTLVSDFP